MVNGNGEGQPGVRVWWTENSEGHRGLDRVTEGRRMDRGCLGLGHVNEQDYMEGGDEDNMIRVYAGVKQSVGKNLVDCMLEDIEDTSRHWRPRIVATQHGGLAISALKPQRHGYWVSASRPWGRLQGGTWRHRRACINAKWLHKGLVAVRCMKLKFWTISAAVAKWLSLNLGTFLVMCNSPLNKRSDSPRQPSFHPLLFSLGLAKRDYAREEWLTIILVSHMKWEDVWNEANLMYRWIHGLVSDTMPEQHKEDTLYERRTKD
jgi:hypothetical protein